MTARTAEYCERKGECAQLRVNGDHVSLVSVEHFRKTGIKHENIFERKEQLWYRFPDGHEARLSDVLRSDIRSIPKGYVLAHDSTGAILDPCEFFILKWRSGAKMAPRPEEVREAEAYFGEGKKIRRGRVQIPQGKWRKICRIAVIRYTRYGDLAGDYEHPYDLYYEKPVWLFILNRPLAFKLRLPDGCLVDERGFVRP